MTRRDALAQTLLQPAACTNMALWLDRYSIGFDQEIARTHVSGTLESVRVPSGYGAAYERRKRSLMALNGGYLNGETRLYTLTLEGRAILGIGMASVRETNLSLLRPWGLPYLPGSSIKGMASHTAHEGGEPSWARPSQPGEEAGPLQRAIFGDVTGAGAVVFHDAWWIPLGDRPPIHGDTMTVHHKDYYGNTAEAPQDWEEPNPVSFLSISGSYLFAMTGPREALDIAEKLIEEGLKTRGVGAKTAAGYGRARLERFLSEVVRKLEGFRQKKAERNTVEVLCKEFLQVVQAASTAEELAAAESVGRQMYGLSKDVWRDWLQKERCPEEARRWVQPTATAPTPAPPRNEAAPAPRPEEVETNAMAWIAKKKNRPTLFTQLPGKGALIEEELHKLPSQPDEETRQALESAPPGNGIQVRVKTNGKRVRGVRLG
jgi:CRISPR-associated protein Cmr6